MPSENQREDVFRVAEELRWTVDPRASRKGYLKLKCSCGRHLTWLHKTPSNPNYYAEKIRFMRRTCPGAEVHPG